MPEISHEKTYAERVASVYEKVKKELGEENASFLNEIVRGASLLDEDTEVLSKIEALDIDVIRNEIERLKTISKNMMQQLNVDSVYEAFEKTLQGGRSKLKIWKDDRYEDIMVSKEEEKLLPWGGEIRFGGKEERLKGMFTIVKDVNIDFNDGVPSINGHIFNNIVRFVDQTLPDITNDRWDGLWWKGKWSLARDESGKPLRGGPDNKLYMKQVPE